jgi:hypothetical protein
MKKIFYLLICILCLSCNNVLTSKHDDKNTEIIKSTYYALGTSSDRDSFDFGKAIDNIKQDINILYNRTENDYEDIDDCFKEIESCKKKTKKLNDIVYSETRRRLDLLKEVKKMQKQMALLISSANKQTTQKECTNNKRKRNDDEENSEGPSKKRQKIL